MLHAVPSIHQLQPMLASSARHQPFSHPDWVFEIKHDGWRLLAQFGHGDVILRTRNGHDATAFFPEIVESLGAAGGGPHVVDGEVCVLDEVGRSDFERLQGRARLRRFVRGCDPVVFAMFDILVEGSAPVMHEPLIARKARLQRLFTPRPSKTLLVLDAIPQHGVELFECVRALQLEGLVAKRADSIYVPGERTDTWRKIKRAGAVPPERFGRVKPALRRNGG